MEKEIERDQVVAADFESLLQRRRDNERPILTRYIRRLRISNDHAFVDIHINSE